MLQKFTNFPLVCFDSSSQGLTHMMKSKVRVFVFTTSAVICMNASAQQGALLEACNALEDKLKRLACFQELNLLRPATESSAAALKTLKASFFAIAGLVDTGTSC